MTAAAIKPGLRLVTPPDWSGKPHDPQQRGMIPTYRRDRINDCPGCGRSQWIIGRMLAECAFCCTALPLADVRDVMSGRPSHAD